MTATHWRTKDGQRLEIRWMTTRHLINSWKMLKRSPLNNFEQRKPLEAELRDRGRDRFSVDNAPDRDETLLEMCQLRAILDTPGDDERRSARIATFWFCFRSELVMTLDPSLIPKFTEYRLTR